MQRTIEQLRRAAAVVATLCLISIFACSDDETGAGQADGSATDTGRDVQERDRGAQIDVGDDIAEETGTDTVEDIDSGEPLPETETDCTDEIDNDGDTLLDCEDDDCDGICEICNDLVDNNDDVVTDCNDPWCSDSEYCPEQCNNNTDDDADGAVDCDDSECAEVARCSEPTSTPDTYTFSEQLSYFWRIQFPATASQCCFDFTGDQVNDNALLQLLSVVPDYDAPTEINAVVNEGELGLLIEWLNPPVSIAAGDELSFNVYRGVPTVPAPVDSAPPHDPDDNDWIDGDGLFQIARDSFDDRGPGIRFRGGVVSVEDELSTVLAGPASFRLTVPIPPLGTDLDVTVNNTIVEMDLAIETRDPGPNEVKTVPNDSGATEIAGGRLGGIILLDDMMQFFNRSAEMCDCSKPSTEAWPLVVYGETATPVARYSAECLWSPLGTNDFGYSCVPGVDSPFCSTLDTLCGVLPAMALFADVDSNGNGIKDAFSAGLRFDLVRAQLDDPPVEPAD